MLNPIIKVDQISFSYDQHDDHNDLDRVSFTVDQGERIAVIGNNGSGKSTLAQLLVGLLTPHDGKIYIAGTELTDQTKWKVRQHINIVFQNPDNQLVSTTVEDDIAFGLENINVPFNEMKKRVDQVLGLVGMSSFRKHDPSRLSGGQKQRVAIASILALQPDIIVLDEALVMLDPQSRRDFLKTLQHIQDYENMTIISITHDMDEAAASDRVIVIDEGKISRIGTPAQIFAKEKLPPPFPEQLRRNLAEKNRQVPQSFMSEEEMVNLLCK